MKVVWWAVVAVVGTMLAACSADSPPAEPTQVLFFGDSYTVGTGLDDASARWTSQVATELGWVEINAGCPGSGFTRSALRCGTFAERLPELAVFEPDVVVVAGGLNDRAHPDPEPAIAATLDAVAQQWPDADVWVVSAVGYAGMEDAAVLDQINAALESHARARSMRWLDLGQPLLDRPDLILGDRLHPTEAGHRLIALAFLAALKR